MNDRTGNLSKAVLALGIALLVVSACNGDDIVDPGDLPGPLITVVLVSDGSNGLPIHILAPGENFDASNRLEPGQQRETTERIPQSSQLTYRAGRNGTVLVSVTCDVVAATDGFVRWIDGRLECENGLRNL